MKKKLMKFIIPIMLSLFCGVFFGKMVYNIYSQKITDDIYGIKIYLVQAGAYSSYDNMVSNTSLKGYIYYEDDDGLFKSIIGLTENFDNIDKIKSTYTGEVVISEYYSKDEELNEKIKEYDKKIESSSDSEEIKEIVIEMLSLYKDTDATLVSVLS